MLKAILTLALILGFTSASAQERRPTVIELTQPIIISDVPDGTVFDARHITYRAIAPMDCVICIIPPPGEQRFGLRIDLGRIDANGLAGAGIWATRIQNSRITAMAVDSAIGANIYVYQSGFFGTFNNRWIIGALRLSQGNGLLIDSRMQPSIELAVQGNVFRIGQIIENWDSGIAVFGSESTENLFIVGPVEHNGLYGCYDQGRRNQWIVVNSNHNGLRHVC